MITINQVTHNFGKKVLYNGINCVIGSHDRIALVGSNGSGKTTLLRMIMGEQDCDAGSFDKADYVTVGYLPQDGIHVHLHERHRSAAMRRGVEGRSMHLFREPFDVGEARVEPVLLAHDDLGSVGYRVEYAGIRLGWATDIGRVPKALRDSFTELHVLGIESNYEPDLQRRSGRPVALVRRIMSGRGHLSNQEALEFACGVSKRSPDLQRIVKLHLSQQCNRPEVVRALYESDAPDLADRVVMTSQREATALIEVKATAAPRQMEFFQ